MPIDKLIKLAIAVMTGIVISHPLTYMTEIRRIEFSILKEIGNTRSWGNPLIFQYAPHKGQNPKGGHHAK